MLNAILFKNGEMEFTKTVADVMMESNTRYAIIPVPNYNKGVFTLKSLECNFHFVKNCYQFARLVECSYFIGSVRALNSDIDKLERKDLEDELTEKQRETLEEKREVVEIFTKVIATVYSKEEQAFCDYDKLIKFISVYYTKDTSAFSVFPGFINFMNNLQDEKPTQVLKPLLDKVVNSFSVEENDIYLPYQFHANTTLVEDCKSRYYKGRKVKKGKVTKDFDTEGKLVRLEIVLAFIEDLQTKSRKKYEEEHNAYLKKLEEEAEKKAKEEERRRAEAEAKAKAKTKAKEEKEKADKSK